MKYKESKEILKTIKESRKVAISCHRNPDPDTLGSAVALYKIINKMGKEVSILCPTRVPKYLNLVPYYDRVRVVDFRSFDFIGYDLLITVDCSSWDQVTDIAGYLKPELPVIVIDHHKTNKKFGDLNLVERISSVSELVYGLITDWEIEINKDIANALLAGIISDTWCFQNTGANLVTLQVATELIGKGGDKERIVFNLFRSNEFKLLRLWGEILTNMKLDNENKFVWSAVDNGTFVKFGMPRLARSSAATIFLQGVEGTNFGIVLIEEEKGVIHGSLRSRNNFDISGIALALGGGGHKVTAGFKLKGGFEDTVKKVISTVIKELKRG